MSKQQRPNIAYVLWRCVAEWSFAPFATWVESQWATMRNAPTFFVVTALSFGFIGWLVGHNQASAAFASLAEKRMLIDARYEDALNSDSLRTDQKAMQFWADSAFRSGDYAYCIRFVEAGLALGQSEEWEMQSYVFGEASKLALYPTSEGFSIFTNNITHFIVRIEKNYAPTNSTFHSQFSAVIAKLGEIEERLPETRREFVREAISQLIEFKKSADSIKSP